MVKYQYKLINDKLWHLTLIKNNFSTTLSRMEKRMKIVICDDHQSDISVIKDILLSYPPTQSSKIDTYTSGDNLIQSIKENVKYDIAFLDVDMPLINGIDLGRTIKELSPNTRIVFVTSYPQYAIEAYNCEAFNYLLKPVDTNKAIDVIKRLVQKYKEENKYIIIKEKSKKVRININDIYYIECYKRHIFYHLKDEIHDTVDNISKVLDKLKEYGFYQIHQGYIVNFNKIKCFDKYSAILDDNRSVEISIRKKKEVLLAYSKYMEK